MKPASETASARYQRINRATPPEPTEGCRFFNKRQMSHRYVVSLRTIDYWMESGVLPFVKIGKKLIRFDPQECDAALERFKVNNATID